MGNTRSVVKAEIVSRTVLGVFGSYLLASASLVAITRLWPDGGRTAVSLGEMTGFALFGVAAIAAFSIRNVRLAWLLIVGCSALLFALGLVFGTAGGRP